MARAGGKSLAHLFRVKDSGTAYTVVKLDGTTAATTHADASCVLDETVKTSINYQSDGTVKISWDQDVVGALLTVRKAVVANSSTAGLTIGERVYEDGSKKFGAAGSSSEYILVIAYGSASEDAGEVEVVAAIGTLDPTSGSRSWEATNSSKPTAAFNGIFADYSIDVKAFLDSDVVTVPSTFIIAANTPGLDEEVTKAA